MKNSHEGFDLMEDEEEALLFGDYPPKMVYFGAEIILQEIAIENAMSHIDVEAMTNHYKTTFDDGMQYTYDIACDIVDKLLVLRGETVENTPIKIVEIDPEDNEDGHHLLITIGKDIWFGIGVDVMDCREETYH